MNDAAKFFMKNPAQTSADFINYVDLASTAGKLGYGCKLDEMLTPALPGDYISIMARPGNKKSTFMAALAKRYAMDIKAAGSDDVVIYATWDEAVENIEGYIAAGFGHYSAGDIAWGRVTREQAASANVDRVTKLSQLYVWGVSIMDKEHGKPLFTADWLFKTVQELKHREGVNVRALFLDYLQIIPVQGENNRTAQVSEASKAAKALAKDIGCPVFAGVQAGRQADSREDNIPNWSDAQHASQIEQDSTKQLALMSPVKYLDNESLALLQAGKPEMIEKKGVGGKFYEVNDDLTIVRILKQRGARGAGTVAIGIDKTTLKIYDPTAYLAELTELS